MTVKIVGTHSNPNRIHSGYYSLDHVFVNKDGDIGLPVGIGYEVFGLNHTGKSTFCYSLAAVMAREVGGEIALCDFEGFDDIFLTQVANTNGFNGKIYIASEEQDEDQLDKLVTLLTNKCDVGILDSIGAIAPMGESKGDIGEANMGKRAFLMAQFSRKMLKLFRFSKNKTVLMINHWYPKLGGYGYDTPGGEAKKYLASIRIKLQRGKEEFPDKSYTLIGTVIKNRWGYQDGQFYIFVLAGFGMHRGMSALWDCVMLKLIKRVKGNLMYGSENLGKLGHYARAAKEGKDELFAPFYTLLEEYGKTADYHPGEVGGDSNTDTDASEEPDEVED
jgi:RecA/RadA recombinase